MRRIVIVGGGVIGSAIAYHLAEAGAAADVVVVEPDPTYEFAATPRAVGGIRLQHAIPENVEMSLYGDAVFSDFARQVTGGLLDLALEGFGLAFHFVAIHVPSYTTVQRPLNRPTTNSTMAMTSSTYTNAPMV